MTEANGPEATQTTAPTDTATVVQGSSDMGEIKLAGPLSEDNRAVIEAKKWADEAGAVDFNKSMDAYRNLEAQLGKSIVPPGENATVDDWNAFYAKLGRPETADKYELKLDASSLPENFPYDEKSAIEYRTWAHEAGLSPRQAQMLHDKFVGSQAAMFSQSAEAMGQRAGEAHREIVNKWGPVESESYKRNAELMSRAVIQTGLGDAFKAAGLLSDKGEILNPSVAFAFSKIGSELYSEDTMMTGTTGALNNPFADSTLNRTKQSELIRSDPQKAKALIAAAGKNPVEWGL